MEQNALANRVQSSSKAVAEATTKSMLEFGRAIATVFVGGLFMFYSYVTGTALVQSLLTGAIIKSMLAGFMFLLAFGSMVYFVGILNGAFEDPLM